METSQWRRAVENRCVFSAHLKALSDKSGDHSALLVADGSMCTAGPLTAKPVECQPLQIANADDLRWQ